MVSSEGSGDRCPQQSAKVVLWVSPQQVRWEFVVQVTGQPRTRRTLFIDLVDPTGKMKPALWAVASSREARQHGGLLRCPGAQHRLQFYESKEKLKSLKKQRLGLATGAIL